MSARRRQEHRHRAVALDLAAIAEYLAFHRGRMDWAGARIWALWLESSRRPCCLLPIRTEKLALFSVILPPACPRRCSPLRSRFDAWVRVSALARRRAGGCMVPVIIDVDHDIGTGNAPTRFDANRASAENALVSLMGMRLF